MYNRLQVNDRDAKGQTALHIASRAGHAPVVSALLSCGVDFEACDYEGICRNCRIIRNYERFTYLI